MSQQERKFRMFLLRIFVIVVGCALSVWGCGDATEDEYSEIGTAEQDLTAKSFHGWRWDFADGWDHHRCNMNVSSNSCLFPPRLSIDYAGIAGPSSWYTAVVNAESLFESVSSFRFFPTVCAGGSGDTSCLELKFLNESYGSTGCPAQLPLHDVVHVACVDYTGPLAESYVGEAGYCNLSQVGVDFSRIEAWFTCRGLNSSQKDNLRKQVMAHVLGTAAGLGSTDSQNTPMSLTILSSGPQLVLQASEVTRLSTYNPTSPGFTVVP